MTSVNFGENRIRFCTPRGVIFQEHCCERESAKCGIDYFNSGEQISCVKSVKKIALVAALVILLTPRLLLGSPRGLDFVRVDSRGPNQALTFAVSGGPDDFYVVFAFGGSPVGAVAKTGDKWITGGKARLVGGNGEFVTLSLPKEIEVARIEQHSPMKN